MTAPVSTPPTTSDPLGIANVNGFYGNGAWAGWFITLVSSWIGILYKPTTKNHYDLYLHLLYTNWAAVDIIRQLPALPSLSAEAKPGEPPLFGALAAAFTVAFWGIIHAGFQLHVCIKNSQDRLTGQSARQCFRQRYTILMYGLLLPSSALTAILFNLSGPSESHYGKTRMVPALYYDGVGEYFHFYAIQGACAIAQWVVVLAILLILTEWQVITGVDIRGLPMVAYFVAVVFFLFSSSNYKWLTLMPWWLPPIWFPWIVTNVVLFHLLALIDSPLVMVSYVFQVLGSGGKIVRKSCFFMPCAPQGIGDWDQAFALLCGLGMFVYEVGPLFISFLRRRGLIRE